MNQLYEAQHLRQSERIAARLVGFDIIQRTLIEQTLGKLYTSIQAKCQLKFNALSQQLMPPFVRQLVESVPRATIVEINCGYGFLANYLSLCCPDAHIVGIDNNREKISEAKNSIYYRQNLQFISQHINKVPKIEADLIILNLDQWDEMAIDQMDRIHQWLTPGGDILIRTSHTKTNWRKTIANILSGKFKKDSEVFKISETNMWQSRLGQSGFTCLAEYDATQPVNTWLAKLAVYWNSYVWYHAEKPIFNATQPSKFQTGKAHTNYASSPQPQYALLEDKLNQINKQETGLSQKELLKTLAGISTQEESDDLGYIFSKPWPSLKQDITSVS